jgi:uncharacterized protein YcbX
VKGLGGEALDAASLTTGQGLPHDRRFALARGDTQIDPARPRWLPKQRFVMLMRDTALARVGCRIDPARETIELSAPSAPSCAAAWGTAEGRAQLEAYLNALLGTRPEGRARWIESGEASFTDVPQNCLSPINLESVRAVAEHLGRTLDPRRFRANLYLSGLPPWAEFDWVGREIAIGDVALRIAARIPRCAATAVNPETGERDVNVVKELRAAYGHYDMGVYAEVAYGGRIATGDPVTPPSTSRSRSRLGHWLRFLGFVARGAPTVLRRR